VFQYSSNVLELEIGVMFPWILLQTTRIFLASRGNKMEETIPTVLFLILTIGDVFVHLFFLFWQSYVLLFDIIIGSFGLLLLLGELVTGGLLCFNLTRA
jgi:transmembrane protein 216